MTLTICIPVYNWDVRPLVKQLLKQRTEAIELLLLDDGSASSFREMNRPLGNLDGVTYEELPENVGRSKIRNLLAERAQSDFLLFMDVDSMPISDHYLADYLEHLPFDGVLYGGRCYQKFAPDNPLFYFHWHYGTKREVKTAIERRKHPYHSFMTNNYVISRKLALEIPFETQLEGYGHEDTLFGFALAERKVPIKHLDNPLEHIGLEETKTFLRKSREGLRNLAYLIVNDYPVETRLTLTYRKVRRWRLHKVLAGIAPIIGPQVERNLYSSSAILKTFDFYKLCWLAFEIEQVKGQGARVTRKEG